MKTSIRHYAPRSIWIVMAVTGLHAAADSLRAQHDVFHAGVIQKWKDYEIFSRTLQGTARHHTIRNGKPQDELVKVFKQNRECALVILPDKRDPSLLFCALTNPHYLATINYPKSDLGNAVLQKYTPHQGATESMSPFDIAFYETSRHFAYGPTTRLLQAVLDPSFKVTGVTKETQNGQELIRVDHIYNIGKHMTKNNSQMRVQGSLWLDPSRSWCIRRFKGSYEVMLHGERSSDMEEEILCETVDHPSGFPILKSRTQHVKIFQYKNKLKTDGTSKADYELEVNDNVPDREFTLAAFGLPEPGSEPMKKNIPMYVWILIAAVFCAALALGFRYLAYRIRPKPAL